VIRALPIPGDDGGVPIPNWLAIVGLLLWFGYEVVLRRRASSDAVSMGWDACPSLPFVYGSQGNADWRESGIVNGALL
jgi:hypothetical protein